MKIPSELAGTFGVPMDQFPHYRRTISLLRVNELIVRRRFHGRGPSSSVISILTVIDRNIGDREQSKELMNGSNSLSEKE